MHKKMRKSHLAFTVALVTIISISLFGISQSKPTSPKLKNDTTKSQQVSTKDFSDSDGTRNDGAYNIINVLASEEGVKEAWKYVIDTYYQKETQDTGVHDYAHYVGQLIFDTDGLDGMTICTPELAFGCYHGLLDKAFRDGLSSLLDAQKACDRLKSPGPVASCTHGIGHGVASYFKTSDIKNALKTCDKLPGNSPQYCYDGVFMEFANDALDSFYHKDDPLYPCNSVDKKYTYACGRNLPAVLIDRFERSFIDVANLCEKAKDPNLKTSCFTALGFQASRSSPPDISQTINLCESLKDKNFQYQCKSAAAGNLIFQNSPNWQTNSPKICATLSEPQSSNCNSYTDRIRTTYNR